MEQTKYDVFISYSRKDYVDEHKNVIPGNEVSKIKEALTNAGITYWFDEKGVIPGEDYAAKITKQIKACKIFLYISSKAANESDWTRKEIATALMYNKYIVPLLLDTSPFHDSVILRIADLDRIDYYVNQQLGLDKLVCSINIFLEEKAEEEKRKKEAERKKAEERRKKEEEEKEEARKKREQEQKKLIAEIELAAAELDNVERDAELKRRRLINSAQNVEDENERKRLLELIDNSGALYKKHKEEVLELTKRFEEKNRHLQEIFDKRRNKEERDSDNSHPSDNKRKKLNLLLLLFLFIFIIGIYCGMFVFGRFFRMHTDIPHKDNEESTNVNYILPVVDTTKIYNLSEVDEEPKIVRFPYRDTIGLWYWLNGHSEIIRNRMYKFYPTIDSPKVFSSYIVERDGIIDLEYVNKSNTCDTIKISLQSLGVIVRDKVIPGRKDGINVRMRGFPELSY